MGTVAWPLWGGSSGWPQGLLPVDLSRLPCWRPLPSTSGLDCWRVRFLRHPSRCPHRPPESWLGFPFQRQRPLSSRSQEPDGQTSPWVSLPGLPGGQAASAPNGGGYASHVTQRGERRSSFSQERRALGPRDTPCSM